MKVKLISIGVVVLVLALLLTLVPGCGKGEVAPGVTPTPGTPGVTPTPTPQAKTVKMALLVPLSGPGAPWGMQIGQGMEWKVNKVNAAGGFKVGADTYVIKMIKCDDKLTGSAGAECATRFVYEDGLHYIIGPISTYGAIEPIIEEGKCFSYLITNAEVPSPEKPYFILGAAPVRFWYDTFWDQAYQFHPEIKTVAVVNSVGPTTDIYFDAVRACHEEHGATVIMERTYQSFTTDYYPILTPIVAKNPDCIEMGGNIGDIDLMVKQARELGYKGPIAGSAHGDPSSTIRAAGVEYAENFWTNDPDYNSELYPESTRELYAEFVRLYPGQPLALITYMAYGGVEMYIQAMQKAGSVDPDAVTKVFDDPNWTFEYFGMPGKSLGGVELFGIRRYLEDEVGYSEVHNGKKVMKSRKAVEIP